MDGFDRTTQLTVRTLVNRARIFNWFHERQRTRQGSHRGVEAST
jgi:hypothetical protein